MFDSLKSRFILFFALAVLSVWTLVDRGVLLGLDLRGGTHLAVEIDDPTGAMNATARADAGAGGVATPVHAVDDDGRGRNGGGVLQGEGQGRGLGRGRAGEESAGEGGESNHTHGEVSEGTAPFVRRDVIVRF